MLPISLLHTRLFDFGGLRFWPSRFPSSTPLCAVSLHPLRVLLFPLLEPLFVCITGLPCPTDRSDLASGFLFIFLARFAELIVSADRGVVCKCEIAAQADLHQKLRIFKLTKWKMHTCKY